MSKPKPETEQLYLRILEELQSNGERHQKVLAHDLGISLSKLSHALRALRERGVLGKRVHRVHIPEERGAIAFMEVVCQTPQLAKQASVLLAENPYVIGIYMFGTFCKRLVKIIAPDTQAVAGIQRAVYEIPGVTHCKADVVLGLDKESTEIHPSVLV